MILARLQGGRFDGIKEELDYEPVPNLVGAYKCPNCSSVHVLPYFEVRGYEGELQILRYRFVRIDEKGALYRYADLSPDDPPGEEVPATAPEGDIPLPGERVEENEPLLQPV